MATEATLTDAVEKRFRAKIEDLKAQGWRTHYTDHVRTPCRYSLIAPDGTTHTNFCWDEDEAWSYAPGMDVIPASVRTRE